MLPIALTGAWLIFWERLLEPSMPELADLSAGLFEMPAVWNGWEYRGEPVGGDGYATFVATVMTPPHTRRLALFIPNASTAYRLWANGVEVAASNISHRGRGGRRPGRQYV